MNNLSSFTHGTSLEKLTVQSNMLKLTTVVSELPFLQSTHFVRESCEKQIFNQDYVTPQFKLQYCFLLLGSVLIRLIYLFPVYETSVLLVAYQQVDFDVRCACRLTLKKSWVDIFSQTLCSPVMILLLEKTLYQYFQCARVPVRSGVDIYLRKTQVSLKKKK